MTSIQFPVYVGVILPVALPGFYTYSVPVSVATVIEPGQRVIVQFGKQRIYSAVVYKVFSEAPEGYEVKPVLSLIDEAPVVSQQQFKLWEWMADYYQCTLGEIMLASLPSALRLESETVILLNEEAVVNQENLTDREYLIWEALTLKKKLSVKEVTAILSLSHIMPVIRNLLLKGVAVIQEELVEKYKPRFSDWISLAGTMNEEKLGEVIRSLEKKL